MAPISPSQSPSQSPSPPQSPSPLRPARKRPRGAGATTSPSPPRTIQAQYEAAIRGLGSSRSLPVPPSPPQSGGVPPSTPPALIPAEEYVEDWLEDDLGGQTGRKRGRREPRGGLGVPGGGLGVPAAGFGVPRGGFGVPGAARRRRHRPPPRAPQGSPEAPGEEAQAPPGPAPPPPIRVRVRVQGDVFLIPVPQGSGLSVSWLAAQAAERYRQAWGGRPQLTLSKEGALLAPHDLVGDVLRSNEEVLAEVQCWELPPLAERYRTACSSMGLAPQPLLLRAAERQACARTFSAGGLAPSPPQLPPLLRALQLQPPLRQLRLGGCGVADAHGPQLGAALSTLPTLLLLDLSGNRLGARGLGHLAGTPPRNGCALRSLEELDLSLNPLGDAGCRPLALLLRSCPALSTLRLRACGFSPRCHLALSHGLAGASQLRALALAHNALGAAGLEPLLRALPAATLEHLDVGSVRGEDPLPLAAALGGFLERGGRALARLELPGNGLDDAAVAELLGFLPSCPSLVSLDLSANPSITSAGLRALLGALGERNRRLQYLSLAGCSVEGPLDGVTWARAATGVRDLRLCGRGVKRGGPPGTDPPGAFRRHRKLFCTSL